MDAASCANGSFAWKAFGFHCGGAKPGPASGKPGGGPGGICGGGLFCHIAPNQGLKCQPLLGQEVESEAGAVLGTSLLTNHQLLGDNVESRVPELKSLTPEKDYKLVFPGAAPKLLRSSDDLACFLRSKPQ